ncbi:taurocyamine kinase-like [Gigantopelta aegis]|uniref:taurocyamine kinase-like n=1 Tax=Gigantopelta aegis TaxID=1735272 RepID=UPI001B88A77B|nr:taurocyamine kinase-like [Gigantopelta aegis]
MAEDLEAMFKKLTEADDCKSLLKKHLTKEIFEKVKDKKTTLGGTLADCIRSGVENLDSGVGIYACDPEAYKTFADILDPVIKDYHKIPENKPIKHPHCDFGDPDKLKLEDLDPDGKYIISTRVRVGRSHDGMAFPPILTKEQREEMEKKTCEALDALPDDLKGKYHPLAGMDADTQKQLTDDHFLFNDHDRFLRAAGGYNDWPAGRGIFYNEDKTFLVWVNEEDHLRLISMQKGGDIGAVYKRLVKAIKSLEEKLKYARDERLGYLTFCPSNLGTTLRASVHIKIPTLAAKDNFKEICDKYHLQARGIHGEHTASEGGVYDVSNKRRLGLSEVQAVTEMYNGVKEFIKLEKELSWKPESVEEMFEHVHKAKNCKSLMKKHLTKDVFEKLKEKKTSHNATLGDCIKSGVMNLDSGVGIYAADPESYTVFAELFDPVIKDYHKIKSSDAISHPESNFGNMEDLGFGDLDPEGELIISTRIRVARSHKEFAFPPVLTKEDRIKMEKVSSDALNTLSGGLKGTYYPLAGMSKETQDQLTEEHFLFNDHDRFLKVAGGYNDWPTGRGIFYNEDKTFLVWVNEEDHLRLISMQKGGDIAAIYTRLVTAIKELGNTLTFAHDDRLGFVTFCPSNLGTTLRASVHIKIPHLSARKDFKNLCEKYKLQARGIHGEHTESEGGVYDISNKRRLGLTEIDAVKEMVTGIKEVIRFEKELASGKHKSSSCVVI